MQSSDSIEPPSIRSYLKLGFGALIILFLLVFVLSTFGICPITRHIKIIKVAMSPDKKLKAVVFLQRYFPNYVSVNISVLNSTAEVDNGRDGNIFSQNQSDWADAKWIDDHSLHVVHTNGEYYRLPNHFTAYDRDLQIEEQVLKGY